VTGVFDGIGLTRPLWPHQVRALAALDRDVARGDRARTWWCRPAAARR
jgi:hypothetical protein